MLQPHGRVVILHRTLILGGFVVTGLGEPTIVLVPFVAAKTVVEPWVHLRHHRTLAEGR